MSFWRLPTQVTEQAWMSRSTHTRLSARWLGPVRGAWIVVMLFMLGVAIASQPASFVILHQPCTADAVTCNGNGPLIASQIQALSGPGLSLDTYAWSWIVTNGLVALLSFVMGGILFWRRSDDWMVLLVALLFGSLGATNATTVLEFSSSLWSVLENSVLLIQGLAILLTLALFPNGRFAPRWVLWIVLVNPAYTAFYLVSLNQLHLPGWTLFNNPVNAVAWFGCWIILTLAQLYRYFRVSTPIERQQTKWVAFSFLAILIVEIVGFVTTPTLLSLQNNGFLYLLITDGGSVIHLFLPLSIGIAILRYRLYEIDRIINRTLVYGTLTLSLALLYAGLILGLQALLGGVIQQTNDIALVVSTLAIYVLFQPLHRRIQTLIDRRFYRQKYDAASTLAAFSVVLRTEVDLGQLSEHVVTVVQETMHPTFVSLWLVKPKKQALATSPQSGSPDETDHS